MKYRQPTRVADKSFEQLQGPIFIIGAAYCGKSEFAHKTLAPNLKTLVVGTAELTETLLAARVQELRSKRHPTWQHLEATLELPKQLTLETENYEQLLLDSINQWIANLLLTKAQKYSIDELQGACEAAMSELVQSVFSLSKRSRMILVSSEVGAGVIPPKPIARLFRHLVSRTNCQIAELSANVIQVTAGIPRLIKGSDHVQLG